MLRKSTKVEFWKRSIFTIAAILMFAITGCFLTPSNANTGDPNEPLPKDLLLAVSFDGNLESSDGIQVGQYIYRDSATGNETVVSPTFAEGIKGKSIQLNNASHMVTFDESVIDRNVGTLSVWIKPNWNGGSSTDWHTIAWYGNKQWQEEMRFLIHQRKILQFWGYNGGKTISTSYQGANEWIAGTWYHVVFTWDSATKQIKLYVDGSLEYSRSEWIPFEGTVLGGRFYVGALHNATHVVDASIDELRVYNRVLSDAEIMGLYKDVSTK